MKRIIIFSILISLTLLVSCSNTQAQPDPEGFFEGVQVDLDMNMNYPIVDNMPDGNREPLKVILLLGQSNASGCSAGLFLKNNIGEEAYSLYENGFDNVLINYCIDNHNATSNGEFVKVDMTCGAYGGAFGPEVGMAEVLSKEFPNENIVILKYTMSGYTINYHWLLKYERADIYEAFLKFVETYMNYLLDKGYNAKIGAICWMQGESDTTDFKASRYYENQVKLVEYMRADLSKYAENEGIYFIDAGISNSPYCEPGYPEVNKAKEQFAALSGLNVYFSTIQLGFTIHKEPEGDPDWGHYDSVSELELGREFGKRIVDIYNKK